MFGWGSVLSALEARSSCTCRNPLTFSASLRFDSSCHLSTAIQIHPLRNLPEWGNAPLPRANSPSQTPFSSSKIFLEIILSNVLSCGNNNTRHIVIYVTSKRKSLIYARMKLLLCILKFLFKYFQLFKYV